MTSVYDICIGVALEVHITAFCFLNNHHHLIKRLLGYVTFFAYPFAVLQGFTDAIVDTFWGCMYSSKKNFYQCCLWIIHCLSYGTYIFF